jgi:hypothetical protein
LFSKAHSIYNKLTALITCLVFIQCGTSNTGLYNDSSAPNSSVHYVNQFTVPGQRLPAGDIKSIQFFRGAAGSAPIIELNSSQRLTLQFDDLGIESDMFRVEITHHQSDWSDSRLLPNFYLRGFQNDYFGEGTKGRPQNPSYLSYSYTFPNEQMGVTRSGNYMMHIYRQYSNQVLFSMPFFVVESIGTSEILIEELFNQDERYLRHHQLFARYKYEDTAIIPQIDLSVVFVQNQFWAKGRKADQQDFSEQFNARMYLSRNRAFNGAYEFFDLDLSNVDRYSTQIVDFEDRFSIPRVILNRDVVNLNIAPQQRRSRLTTSPSRTYDARYALVQFRLEMDEETRPYGDVYLIGGFNQWGIEPSGKMIWNAQSSSYIGEAIVKEGQYAYKYVVLEENSVNDTVLDASFASTRQEYHALIYLRDHAFQVDRLVSVSTTVSE